MENKETPLARSIAIDALRGLAALCVVMLHVRESLWVGIRETWSRHHFSADPEVLLGYATAPIYYGSSAVMLFFVISGYCIHRPQAHKLARDPGFKLNPVEYLKRRLWRIYPVLFAALALTYFFDSCTARHVPDDPRLGSLSLYTLLCNIFTLQNIASPQYGSNAPLWTLSIEIHFYLLYPLVLLAAKRLGTARVMSAILALSLIAIVVTALRPTDIVTFLPYWFNWMIGYAIAEIEAGRLKAPALSKQAWAAIAVGGLALGALIHLYKPWTELYYLVISVSFGILTAWSVTGQGETFWRRVGKPLVFVGVFSYSLYAFHMPFLLFIRAAVMNGKPSEHIAVTFLAVAACIVGAMPLFLLVERWSLRLPGSKRPAVNPPAA